MGGENRRSVKAGVGSTFWFELPLQHSDDTNVIATENPALNQLKCLLLETNPTSQAYIHQLLSAQHMRVDCESSGNSALQLLRDAESNNDPYDLILFNSYLNDMPGDVFARCVEGDPAFDKTKLVSMTYVTHTMPDLYPHKNPRIAAQLSKPIKRSELLRILSAVATGQQISNVVSKSVNREHLEAYAGINILVVEDNAVNQEVALGMLNKIGFQAEVADNGQEGLDALSNGNFDLVLMDCPNARFRRLRSNSGHSQTRRRFTAHANNCVNSKRDDWRC